MSPACCSPGSAATCAGHVALGSQTQSEAITKRVVLVMNEREKRSLYIARERVSTSVRYVQHRAWELVGSVLDVAC
jgi:hypothetical protein